MKQIHTLPTDHELKVIKLELFALKAIDHLGCLDNLIDKVNAEINPQPFLNDRYNLKG